MINSMVELHSECVTGFRSKALSSPEEKHRHVCRSLASSATGFESYGCKSKRHNRRQEQCRLEQRHRLTVSVTPTRDCRAPP